MAHDESYGLERLSSLTTSNHLSPTLTPPTENETPRSRDNVTNETITRPTQEDSEEISHSFPLGISQPSGRVSDTDLQWLTRVSDAGHAVTQPIDVPMSLAVNGMEKPIDNEEEPESRYEEPSPFEEFMRKRQPSISFNPQVTLDSGHRRPLDDPLPKLAINTKARGRSVIQELALKSLLSPPPLLRSHNETDCKQYDRITGQLVENPSQPSTPDIIVPDPRSPQWPLLQSTVESLAIEKERTAPEQGASLTSESTASTIASEPRTPIENMEILLSPLSAHSTFPSFPYPTSLEDSSAWPKARRQRSTVRSSSYTIERQDSVRSAMRQRSRTSRRSTSTSMSPATAFLSRFAATEEVVLQPDSEGQEVGEYVMGKQVGFGGFSTVKEAYTIEGDERICRAVKVVRKQVQGKDELENEQFQAEFEHEVSLWRCLGHRNILPLIEVYVTDYATFCFTKLNTGGTLFDLVRANRQGLSRDLVRRYSYQLASAIRYLHEDVHVVHRDIKLENCLIDISDPSAAKDGGNILLCDFGLAEFVTGQTRCNSPGPYENEADRPPPRNIGPSDTSTSIAGSLQYASPELIMSPAGFLSPVVDVWAYGVVIYALLVGDLPFQHTFQPRVQMKILAGEWDVAALEHANGSAGFEEEATEFVTKCLDMNSSSRWTVAQILKSRWLQRCQEMLEELNESWKL